MRFEIKELDHPRGALAGKEINTLARNRDITTCLSSFKTGHQGFRAAGCCPLNDPAGSHSIQRSAVERFEDFAAFVRNDHAIAAGNWLFPDGRGALVRREVDIAAVAR